MASFTVAVIQHPPVYLNLNASIDKGVQLVKEAAADGAAVAVFPETWLPGYPVWLDFAPEAGLWDHPPAKALYRRLYEQSIVVPSPHLDALLAVAQETNTYIVMGANERVGGTLYNTILYVGTDGNSYTLHRKLMPTYTERLVWGQGDGSTLAVMDTEHGRIGGLICWEHWMPLARAAMHAKQEVLHIAQWPMVKDLHHVASRSYAFEGQCFVAAAGCVLSHQEAREGFLSLGSNEGLALLEAMPGTGDDLVLRGGSAIIGPDHEYLAAPVHDRTCILYAQIDPGLIAEGHLALDTSGHYARPDVFQLHVNEKPQTNVVFSGQVTSEKIEGN